MRAPRGAPTARLACVRPAASVHPEPGSNSPLDMIDSLLCSSAPAAPGPPGPGPAGPSHRHAPTNAAPPGPPRPIPPYPPESEREGSAPAPNRQAPGRKFSAPWAQGPGGQRENFSPKGEIFPRRRAGRGFYGGIGRAEEGHRYAFGAHSGGARARASQEGYAVPPRGTQLRRKRPPAPKRGQAGVPRGYLVFTCAQRPENPVLRRLQPHHTLRCK